VCSSTPNQSKGFIITGRHSIWKETPLSGAGFESVITACALKPCGHRDQLKMILSTFCKEEEEVKLLRRRKEVNVAESVDYCNRKNVG